MKRSAHILFLISVLFSCSSSNGDEEIVLTINNEPVTKAEYLFIMSGLKPEVYSSFGKNLDGPEFWNGNFNGAVPIRILHQKTVQSLKRIKIEQSLMKEYGIANDVTFNGFIKSLNEENARRKKAIENKNPVYGPIEFNERTYFKYLHSERVQKLKKSINIEASVKQEDIKKRYQEIVRTENFGNMKLEELKTYIMMGLLLKKYDEMIDSIEMKSVLVLKVKEKDFSKIQQLLLY